MYSFSSRVRYSECDDQGRLSLVSLIDYLQDCSTFHTESLDLGLDYMAENQFAWLIAAWQIEIVRRPRFCDDIEVSTWCYELGRTLAKRNYVMRTPEGEDLVRADSLWFTYDVKAGRPCRIPASQAPYLSDDPPLDLPPTKRKLSCEGPYVEREPITVVAQHLDTNRHVNNAQYVLMASEALPEPFEPSHIRVQYRVQAHLGDVLVPHLYETELGTAVDLVSVHGSCCVVQFDKR